MARQADRETPAEPGGPAAATPAGDGTDTRWPTWDDIARLHRIPGADGAVPEPPAEPEPVEAADEAVPPTDAADEADAGDGAPDEAAPDEAATASAGASEPAHDAPTGPPADGPDQATPVPPADEPAAPPPPDDDATVVLPPADDAATRPAAPPPHPPADARGPADATTVLPAAPPADEAAAPSAATWPDETIVTPPPPVFDPGLTVVLPPAVDEPPATPPPGPAAAPPPRVSAFGATTTPPEPPPPNATPFPATSSPATASPRVTAGPVPTVDRDPSPLDVFTPDQHRRRWPRRLAITAGVVVVLAGGYVGACYALGDKVPHGATVAGVDVGGLSSSDAVSRLTAQLATATGQPLGVTANGVQAQLDPAAAGLTFDAKATVDGLTGVDLTDPRQLWRQVVGIGDVTPVTSVDRDALTAAIDGLSDTLSGDPVDGAIVFVDGSAHATPAADGWQVDEDAAVRQIADTWLVAARPLTLPTTTVAPDITQQETDQVLADVAQHVGAGPVSVSVGGQTATLSGPTLAANASFVPQDGSLTLQLNGDALRDALLGQLPTLLTPAADAHFEFQNDAPVVVPGTPGTTLDPAQVAAAVAAAAAKPTDRTAELQLVPTDPAQSTAALEALGVKEVVGEFDTPLTADRVRDTNIRQGAANITGVLIRPGETFSLTDALGPVDQAHGFIPAGAIVDGEHTDAIGGGLSQISTTTYNAAFLAGFEIVEHTPHSEWFSRYPEGREATIFTGQIDMKWKNDTPYGALVQAWVSDDRRVHVRIWGTKYWTVESTTSARSNVHPPTTVYNQSPGCEPASAGNPGFTVSVTRKVYLGTELKTTHTWKTTYKPQNQVVCGPPPAG